MSEIDELKEISKKLSQLIILTRLSNSKFLDEFKLEIKKDPVYQSILNLANGSLTAAQLKDKAIEATKSSKATVERRIADLVEKGALNITKKRNETYYENSGLYE